MAPRASRRSTAAAASASPSAARRNRSSRGKVKEELDDTPQPEDMSLDGEGEEDDEEEDDDDDLPGPSRRRSAPKSRPRRPRVKTEDSETDGEDGTPARRRSGKQVSYKEVPLDEVEKDIEDDDAEGEEDDGAETAPTPAKRKARAAKDKEDKPYKREGGGGGRGGFSVKGAAAAAARARWDKVRREKAERGEDSDDGGHRRRSTVNQKKDPRGALENVVQGQTYTVKGIEYTAGDDELILPDDPKGDTKVDEEGRLLGGREYKFTTFTSHTRRNPERVYALTIDAARACGYTDSLAFLRRCPQIVKLSCDAEERQMLIDVKRITGNLKHRMVTMVAVRNVYKLMGARLVKNGRWIDDDYNETAALAECEANNWTPHALVMEDDLVQNQYPSTGGPGRPAANASLLAEAAAMKQSSLSSGWYTGGGPSTHFGGNGVDPWQDMHGRRGRLRQLGVTEEDWILRTAEEARRIDTSLRELREERLQALEGIDGTRGWVYAAEARSAGEVKDEELKEEPKHPLAREVTFEPPSEPLTPAPDEQMLTPFANLSNAWPVDIVDRTPGGKIIIEGVTETEKGRPKVMAQWTPGVVRAAYEPHTQMPHVPLRTQPSTASRHRVSFKPWVGLNGDARAVTAPGIASVEATFGPSKIDVEDTWLSFGEGTRGSDVAAKRRAMVEEAEEWARTVRAKRRKESTSSAVTSSADVVMTDA